MARCVKSDDQAAIGRQIKALRVSREDALTQADLADRAGLSRATVQALESGRGCSLATLLAALGVLGARLEVAK